VKTECRLPLLTIGNRGNSNALSIKPLSSVGVADSTTNWSDRYKNKSQIGVNSRTGRGFAAQSEEVSIRHETKAFRPTATNFSTEIALTA
jgi:hypothetical protein